MSNQSYKILIIYYSLTNNTRMIAEAIKTELNADLLELKPVKGLNSEGSTKYMWGGMQAKMHRKPQLQEYSVELNKYDLIILGTPVWAWTVSPPIRSFLADNDLNQRKIAIWVCAGGNGVKAIERFKKILQGSNIIGELKITEPQDRRMEQNLSKAIAWAKKLKDKI